MLNNNKSFMNNKSKEWRNYQIKKKKYLINRKICFQMKFLVRNKKLKNSNQK